MIFQFRPHGVAPDRAISTLPDDIWAYGINFINRNETSQACRITKEVWANPTLTLCPRFMMATIPVGGNYGWLVGGADTLTGLPKLYYQNGLSTFVWTDVTPAGWAASTDGYPNRWSGAELNGRIFVSPGAATEPAVWSASVPTTAAVMITAVIPTWFGVGVGTRAIRSYRNHLFALGLAALGYDNNYRVCWSSGAAMGGIPAAFTALATNDAGETQFPENGGPLVDGISCGNSFLIFRTHAIHRATFVGGLTVFSIQRLVDGIGLAANNALIQVPGGVAFWSGESVYIITEAGELKNLCSDYVARSMRAQNIPFQRREAFMTYHAPEREVWLFLPDNDQSDTSISVKVWVCSLDSGRWSHMDWNSPTGFRPSHAWVGRAGQNANAVAGFEHPVISVYNPSLSSLVCKFLSVDDQEYSSAATHEPGTPLLELRGRDFGEPTRRKFIRAIRLAGNFPTGNSGSVKIYTRDTREGTATLRQTCSWTAPTEWLPAAVEGRYFDLVFTAATSTSIAPWKLSGFDVEYELRGAW